MITDQSHLDALELGLSHERQRLHRARSDSERRMRQVWVAQREREIASVRAFLGLPPDEADDFTDAELLAELSGLREGAP